MVGTIEFLDNVSVGDSRRSKIPGAANEKHEELLGLFFALSSGAIVAPVT